MNRGEAMSKTSYEGPAVIELFGHNRIAGMVTEQTIGGCSFIRVDVPTVGTIPGFSKFFGGPAIYAIAPCSKEEAFIAADNIRARPVDTWLITPPRTNTIWQYGANYDLQRDLEDDEIPMRVYAATP
jgi:hypothetical protein